MAKGLLPDTHEQSAAAARSYVLRRGRRRDADRRAPQLAALARQGQDLGRRATPPERQVHPDRHLADRGRQQRADRRAAGRRHRLVRRRAACRASAPSWAKPPAEWTGAIGERKDKNLAKMAETLAKNPSPMNFHSALNVIRDVVKANPEAIVVNEGANTLDFARSIVDMYEPRKRLDVGTWGIMGIGMGFAVAAAVTTGKPVIAIEGDSAFGFSGMEVETICRYDLPVCVDRLQQQRRLQGHRRQPARRRRGADGVRQGRALRQDDRGLRRRRRQRDDARRAEEGRWTRRSRRASRRSSTP